MEAPTMAELDVLKYPELRKLAKAAGLRANLKADRLLRTLKKHFHPTVIESNSSDSDGSSTLLDDSQVGPDEEEQISLCHVTHRRGRGKKATQADSSPEMEKVIKPIQGDAVENDTEETSVPTRSMLQNQLSNEDETPENTSDPAENTARRRSKRHRSSGKKPGRKLSKNAGSKPSTPNFKKMHEAHFKKMESIDKYLERKQKRLDTISSTIQDVNTLTKSSNRLSQKTPGSNTKTKSSNRLSEKTPGSNTKTKSSNRLSQKTPGSNTKTKSSNRLSQKTPGSNTKTKSSNRLSQKTPGSNTKKSLQNRFSLLSPAPQTGYLFSGKTPAKRRSAGKRSILVDKSAVKPSTFSSSKMNVRFSGATKDNEHKYSLVKTPARKSSSTFMPSINSGEARKSFPLSSIKAAQDINETNIPAATTPFKIDAENMATPSTNKKMKFDLHASLARPLGYEPHKGKLKPWGETKENNDAVLSKSSVLKSAYKQPPLSTSRADRRKQQEKDRKNNRDKTYGSRRRVAVP